MDALVGLAWMAATACSSGPACYPIAPVPLRELVSRSDAVVIATVDEVRRPDATSRETNVRAKLRVQKSLKGPAGKELVVLTNEHSLCPAPATYVPGSRVLAFLESAARATEYTTVGMSYDVKV